MQSVNLNLENCYGIKRLQKELIFGHKKTFAIYAPNGVMKTSFAKTFKDVSNGSETRDLIFPTRVTLRKILIDGQPVEASSIFVIESYQEDYQSDKVSTLLANHELKEQYDTIHKDIERSQNNLLKSLKKFSGLSGKDDPIIKAFVEAFDEDFYNALLHLETDILLEPDNTLINIKYATIFNDNVVTLLNSEDIKKSLAEYIQHYDKLIDSSPILRRNFKPDNAVNVQEQLSKNNFFNAGHSINLSDGTNKTEYSDDKKLIELFEEEKNKVLNDKQLRERFDTIDNKISKNKDLREFREYLFQNQNIIRRLADLKKLKQDLWISYLRNERTLALDLISKLKNGQEEIQRLSQAAKQQKTDWEKVINLFNNHFSHLPFHLQIKNKDDVILKGSVETIEFVFDGHTEQSIVTKKTLMQVLSNGERRALYILNILFEIEARKKSSATTLFIVDDIADSFDYKNKYAIIDYLRQISETPNFYMVILTHNFDFLRTIRSRGICSYSQCLFAIKSNEDVKLIRMTGINNPFIIDWKKNLNDKKKLIASIPFVRNLIEYKEGEEHPDYLKLTSILHMKDNTKEIIVSDVKDIFETTVNNTDFSGQELSESIYNLILEAAEECLVASEGINLEHKIVLSIAIRLRAEEFMRDKITDENILNNLSTKPNQTWSLTQAYQTEYQNELSNIDIIKRVNLITPENIHINSFMYEPILDMGDIELRELYKEVKNLS